MYDLDQHLRYYEDRGWKGDVSADLPEYVWDGATKMLHMPTTIPAWAYVGLTDRITKRLAAQGVSFAVEDHRERPEDDIPHYFVDLQLWEHQRLASTAFFEKLRWVKGCGVVVAPPRSGKTRLALDIWQKVNQPTLWVAPGSAIVAQTASVARELFGARDVAVVGDSTAEELSSALLVITTAAALLNMTPAFLRRFNFVVLDEFHHFPRNGTWAKHLFKHAPAYYRLGLTGTHGRAGPDDIALEASIGEVVYEIAPRTLLERGLLTWCYVAMIPVPGKLKSTKVSSFNRGGHGTLGIHEHEWRNATAAAAAAHLMAQGRQVIVLVGLKKQARVIADLLRGMVPVDRSADLQTVEVVTSELADAHEARVLDAFRARDRVKCLVATSVIGEGVDLPSAEGLVYARGESSWIQQLQGAYRVATAVPGKQNAVVVDFVDVHHKKLWAHSQARLATYQDNGLFGVSVLGDHTQFASWLAQIPAPGVR